MLLVNSMNNKLGLDNDAIVEVEEKLVELEIPVPSFELQQEIVSKLDNLNDRCNALQKNYQKTLTLCDDLKQSLLRKAFNGEL